MKKEVLTKSILRVLPLGLLFLITGLISCNSDFDIRTGLSLNSNSPSDSLTDKGITGCYSARVLGLVPTDSLCARILEAPERVSEDQPLEGHLVEINKSDLLNSNVKAGDTIEFRIIEYEALYIPPKIYHNRFYYDFLCKVEPCE